MFEVLVYDCTHFCYHVRPNKDQKWYRQTHGSTDLKYSVHIQFHFESNMGGIPPDYTSSHCCVKQKSAEKSTNE